MLELEELVRSAGAEVVRLHLQERPEPDPATFVGRGKLEQIRATVFDDVADLVVFDDELTPAQQRNLEKELEVKVIDRSGLILDIFAQRARSREGKLQVELALLEYRLPRLAGKGTALSRLGGGIGTRGPGETKLESDRRVVRRRISRIRAELDDLEKRRAIQRRKRQGIPMPTVSLVGYTNAGKSTLFNRLTDERTLVSRRMFATLDPLVRRLTLPSGQEALLSDTVGFVRKLPHSLVAAFHATLEETVEAELLLHVVDLSDPSHALLARTVSEVLEEIGASDIPVLTVFNKTDLVDADQLTGLPAGAAAVSARTGAGVERLLEAIETQISRGYRRVRMRIPFERGEVLSALRERGRIDRTEYLPDGIEVLLSLRHADLGRFREFLCED